MSKTIKPRLVSTVTNTKELPYSPHAEQSVLGSLMLDSKVWEVIAGQIKEQDFFRVEHQLIFQAATRLVENNLPIDIVTLAEQLDRLGTLANAGGIDYLIAIGRETPTASNALAYAQIVRDTALRRQMIEACTAVIDSNYNPEGRCATELMDDADRKLATIAEQVSNTTRGFHSMSTLITKALNRIEILSESNSPVTGLATGYTDFDLETSGLHPADLVIVAGRPAMGKTAYVMGIAAHVATKLGKPVAVFSMEMPADALVIRLLASLGHIDQRRMRAGQLEDEEWHKLTDAVSVLANAPLFIDDSPALTTTELRAKAKRLKREHKDLALIIVDYLQLIQSPGDKENRTTEIAAVSRSLKILAKELDVPVIALSQLNRSLEARTNKRPIMSDLRESGAIEQDADLIAFIYRDEVYNEDSQDKGIAEIIISKQRNGPIGTVKLTFLGPYTKFENCARY